MNTFRLVILKLLQITLFAADWDLQKNEINIYIVRKYTLWLVGLR